MHPKTKYGVREPLLVVWADLHLKKVPRFDLLHGVQLVEAILDENAEEMPEPRLLEKRMDILVLLFDICSRTLLRR